MSLSVSGEYIEIRGHDAISLVQPNLISVDQSLRDILNEQTDNFLIENKNRVRKSLAAVGINGGYTKMTRPFTGARRRAKEQDKKNQETLTRFSEEPPVILPEDRSLLYQRLYAYHERISKKVFKVSIPMGQAGVLLDYFTERAEMSERSLARVTDGIQKLTGDGLGADEIERLARLGQLEEVSLQHVSDPIFAKDVASLGMGVKIDAESRDRYKGYVDELQPLTQPIGHA